MKFTTTALLLAIATTAAAQEEPPPAAPAPESDTSLEELLADTPAEPEQAAPAEATPPTPVPEEPTATAMEEAPTIPVAQKPEPTPRLKAPPARAQIEEIVVTATKREQSLRDIPQSISALTGDTLERSGTKGVEDIARMVPGVNFTADAINASQVTIRGISTTLLGNPTTGVLFGDVSFSDVYLPRVTLDPNPFDMQTVEVLKGPQGTLFGSAALNGAVRYVPNPPKFGEWETRWFAQYTTLEQGDSGFAYGAALNVPVGEELAFRGMAFKRESPGWIDNNRTGETDTNSTDQQGVRGILGWRPTEEWDIRLTYVWQQTNTHDSAYTDTQDGELTQNSTRQAAFVDGEYQLADLLLRYQFDGFDVVSDSAWVHKQAHKLNDVSTDLTGPSGPLLLLDDISESDAYSQEIRFVSNDNDSRWRWVAGAVASTQDVFFVPEYYTRLTSGFNIEALVRALGFSKDTGIGGLVTRGDAINVLRVTTDAKIDDIAVFGDVTRKLGDSAELSLGGRYYRSRLDGSSIQDGALVLLQGKLRNVIDGVVEEKGFSPKASLLWHATDEVMYYTAVSRGFRTGGLQPGFTTALSARQAPDRFLSDTLWNYEFGTRTQWLDNTLHVDATVFYIDWQDPQIILGDSVVGIPYLDNVGSVSSLGVEGSLTWLPEWVPGLSINASAAWINTETAEPFDGQDGDVIPKGTQWPFAPRWQTATTVAYNREFGNWRAGAGVTHSFLGKAYADLEQTLELFGYQQWDLQLSLANPAIKWLPEFGFTVSNITDERGVSNHADSGLVPPKVDKTTYIQPRAFILRLSGSF